MAGSEIKDQKDITIELESKIPPVKITVEVRRHAQKGPDGISEQGREDAFREGQLTSESGTLADIPVTGYRSPMPRSGQTLDEFLSGLEAAGSISLKKPTREVLLGFGTAGKPGTFWEVEGKKFTAALAEYQNDQNPNKYQLTPDEIEAPIIEAWLKREDEDLVSIYDPDDAAADAAVPLGRITRLLKRIVSKDNRPFVTENTGIVAITHRGAFEPLLVSGVLTNEDDQPVRDISEVGGLLGLLGGFRLEANRDQAGEVSAEVFINQRGFRVDMTRLDELYERGIQRLRERPKK